MEPHQILIKPVITEASMQMMEGGKYTFRVALTASKPEIAHAVEALFEVPVLKVRTMRVHGKARRRGATRGRTPDWKKAIVTLAPGKTIQFFEGV
jgi:large subunit ribosomal protein L23